MCGRTVSISRTRTLQKVDRTAQTPFRQLIPSIHFAITTQFTLLVSSDAAAATPTLLRGILCCRGCRACRPRILVVTTVGFNVLYALDEPRCSSTRIRASRRCPCSSSDEVCSPNGQLATLHARIHFLMVAPRSCRRCARARTARTSMRALAWYCSQASLPPSGAVTALFDAS